MAALGALYSRFAGVALVGPALAGLTAAVPAICLIAGLTMLRSLVRTWLLLGLACGAGGLFFIGLKPFSMLLGGAILGVLLLREPEGLPPAPASVPYGWRMPISLFLLFAALAACFFLLDPALGRFFLSVSKAETWSFGGFGAFPLLFADAVRTRHWLDPASFADLTVLAQLTPGPLLSASALVGSMFKGFLGTAAALAGFFAASFFVLLAAAPARETIVSCVWARKAVQGVTAVLGGITLGMAAVFATNTAWDVPRAGVAFASLLVLAVRVHPAWVALGSAGVGLLVL
jgi:chromate transporter